MEAVLTAQNILDVMTRVNAEVLVTGCCTTSFNKGYHDRLVSLGQAICEEQGVDYDSEHDTMSVPPEVVLGEESSRIFVELKNWLITQGVDLTIN